MHSVRAYRYSLSRLGAGRPGLGSGRVGAAVVLVTPEEGPEVLAWEGECPRSKYKDPSCPLVRVRFGPVGVLL